jgi:indolepyruvate ferredoxin oxidoreductase
VFVRALEAILKGALESQVPVGLLAAAASARWPDLGVLVQQETAARLLGRHQTEVVIGGDGARAVTLALGAVRAGRSAVALVPASDLVSAVDALRDARTSFTSPEHGLAVLLEDDPVGEPTLCPRRIAHDVGIAIIEPGDLSALRDSIEHALRLSRAGTIPVAVIVSRMLLDASETILARPNRVVATIDELNLQRKARPTLRPVDTLDLMRVARRFELNVATSLPSPGEREVVGFIAVGACERALAHVLEELGLAGRVPVLRLGLAWPVDESILQRLLDRVQQVVVLEPRPGSVASFIIEAADFLRRRGARVPPVASRELPPLPSGEVPVLLAGDATRPSLLVRRIIHLLHAVRPSLDVATRLEARDPILEAIAMPSRDAGIGSVGAMRLVQQALIEFDQDLRSRAANLDDDDREATRILSIDALPTREEAGFRAVGDRFGEEQVSGDRLRSTRFVVETYSRRRFLREGPQAIRQAARDSIDRLIVVVDIGGVGDIDLVRFADGSIPADASARTRVMRADILDRVSLRERMTEALEVGGVTVLIASDGPPPRLDADAIDRTFLERDRLGYQPQQRLVWSADIACEIRPPAITGLLDDAEEEGANPIQGSFTREELGVRVEGVQFRATAISEQVEVVRTKPPITAYSRGSTGLVPPRPLHADQGVYRAHVAGLRGAMPGVVASILADAGRMMGYRVELATCDEPCGRGRRAWSQVLFVRMRGKDARAPRTASIPYGEADLVLGVDAVETLRSLGPDPGLRVASPMRTSVVANDGPLEDQFDDVRLAACTALAGAVERIALAAHSSVDDYASLSRTNLLSERLVDVAMLGVAYQRGLIPVSLEAIEAAVRLAENRGFGRSFEAFQFGRRVEAGAVVRRSVEEREPVERLVRRLALELVRERFGGTRRAERYAVSAATMVASFAQLGGGESVDGATRAVVTALHRSIVWGGTRMMYVYERLVHGLLRADPSGDLAVMAAEPLADAMLVRDILYVLAMSTSLEQRRRIRERLGVRASHGDTLERRFLSRFELLAGSTRYRLDVRSSDWPAEVVRLLRPIVPWPLRGDARGQEVRTYAISLAERAARGFADDPAHWAMCMRRFAMLASDGGLRTLGAAELRASIEGL